MRELLNHKTEAGTKIGQDRLGIAASAKPVRREPNRLVWILCFPLIAFLFVLARISGEVRYRWHLLRCSVNPGSAATPQTNSSARMRISLQGLSVLEPTLKRRGN